MRAKIVLTRDDGGEQDILIPLPGNLKGARMMSEIDKRVEQYAFDIPWRAWHIIGIEEPKK